LRLVPVIVTSAPTVPISGSGQQVQSGAHLPGHAASLGASHCSDG
jgi:hypothetical protein